MLIRFQRVLVSKLTMALFHFMRSLRRHDLPLAECRRACAAMRTPSEACSQRLGQLPRMRHWRPWQAPALLARVSDSCRVCGAPGACAR